MPATLLNTGNMAVNRLKDRSVFLVLFAVSFLIRLPFFFRDYIDRDESTFILMGQSWVEGHLPYTELWDLKPPLVYLFFALIIFFFGKSFIAIRLAGAMVVAIIAFCTYAMGRKMHSKELGFWTAIACIYMLSLFGSLQGVMSEHLSMLFFMPGLYLLSRPTKPLAMLLTGLLMGMAVMTKINLAYAVLLLEVLIIYRGYRDRKIFPGAGMAAIFGIGVVLVIVSTWFPYYWEGREDLWWNSVILAPLEYTGSQQKSFLKMVPMLAIIGAFFYWSIKKKWLDIRNGDVQLTSLAVIGVVLSFVKGGRVNGHYLIQFYPAFLVLLGLVLSRALPPISLRWKALLFLLLLLPVESYKEYYEVARHRIERGTFFNGEGFSVPAYLIRHQMQHKELFFLEYHIGYWLLDKNPPTKAATHPSNLCRDESFKFYGNPRTTSMEELAYIMDELQPQLVVTRHQRRIFDKKEEEENQYMVRYLQEHYRVIALVDMAEIHERLD